ncbi:MAG: hypothetical protein ABR511_06880 [Acidimicrobiales bacterium]
MPEQESQSHQESQASAGAPSEIPDLPEPGQGMVIDYLSKSQSQVPGRAGGPGGTQVTLGLEADVDDGRAARPLGHPGALPGEEPAPGDNSRPG